MIYFEDVKITASSESYLNNTSEQFRDLQRKSSYRALYGSDLSVLGTYELLFEDGVDGQDLLVTSGIPNLAQAVHHRLTTERGTLPEDENIGIPWTQFLGKTYSNKQFVYAQLADIITEEILKDSRVSTIESLEMEFVTPNLITVLITIVAVTGDSFDIQFSARDI